MRVRLDEPQRGHRRGLEVADAGEMQLGKREMGEGGFVAGGAPRAFELGQRAAGMNLYFFLSCHRPVSRLGGWTLTIPRR